jgi:hypothetical protein
MDHRLLSLPLVLHLAGCPAPVTSPPQPRDSGPEPPVDTGEAPPDPVDTGAEHIPDAVANPVFDPPGGAFVDSVTVRITSSTGAGQPMACLAAPREVCEPESVDGPITLDSSTILLARVDVEGIPGEVHARSYVSVDEELAAFESTVPVLVFWTEGSMPGSDTNVPLGLDLFDVVDGAARIADAPASSGRCRMKVRGSSSAGLTKHSYDLELWAADSEEDREEELAGMPADGDWVLYAPYYYDNALIRNALGYTLSERIGRYAPRTRMVELFGASGDRPASMRDYLGVYTLTEEIERGADRVDVSPIGPEDIAEPEVTGGYVFKRDRAGDDEDGFWAGEAGGRFTFYYPLAWVDPEENEVVPPQQIYLEGVLNTLAWALASEDFTDPMTGLHYDGIIDVDSFIDHHILNVLLKNPDAFRLSGYMSKDREGPVVAGPVWDLDRAAGANDSRATDPTHWDATDVTPDTTAYFSFGWYDGLFDDPAFTERYWGRWRELLAGELSAEAVQGVVDELVADLDEPGARNAARWSVPSFSSETANLRMWLDRRVGWIEGCIEAYEDPLACPP